MAMYPKNLRVSSVVRNFQTTALVRSCYFDGLCAALESLAKETVKEFWTVQIKVKCCFKEALLLIGSTIRKFRLVSQTSDEIVGDTVKSKTGGADE